jgi:hypothetical protein
MNAVATTVAGVRRIVRLEPDQAGGYSPVVLYDARAGRKKKKTSRVLRPLDRLVRQLSDAQSTTAIEYLARHRRSSEKKKNGWFKDLGRNLATSQRRGGKRVKISDILTS